MLSTNPDPKLLTDEERVILDVVRGSGVSVKVACEAIVKATVADRQPSPADDADPDDFDVTYAEVRPLAMSITRLAVADWTAAKDRFKGANAAHVDSDCYHGRGPSPRENEREFQAWVDALVSFEADAQARVVACVLMAHQFIRHPRKVDELPAGFEPVALELDGVHYIVAPADEDSNTPVLTAIDGDFFQSCQYGAGG